MKSLGEPTEIIVHHSASPLNTTTEDIRKWHVEERGWKDVGYHYVIDRGGVIRKGRPIHLQGAHCPPNKGRIGICLVGDNTDPNQSWQSCQWASLRDLIGTLRKTYGDLPVFAHNEKKPSAACPGLRFSYILDHI